MPCDLSSLMGQGQSLMIRLPPFCVVGTAGLGTHPPPLSLALTCITTCQQHGVEKSRAHRILPVHVCSSCTHSPTAREHPRCPSVGDGQIQRGPSARWGSIRRGKDRRRPATKGHGRTLRARYQVREVDLKSYCRIPTLTF